MSDRVKEILGWMRSDLNFSQATYHAHLHQVIGVLSKEVDALWGGLDRHGHAPTPPIDRTAELGRALAKAARELLRAARSTTGGVTVNDPDLDPRYYVFLDHLHAALVAFEDGL